MLHVVTWHWGDKYGDEYIERLAAGVQRHLRRPHIFKICRPDPQDMHLVGPGCLVRLRMFDPEWQRRHFIERSDQIVCMDLDAVVTGPLDPLFDRPDPFVILQNVNATNPCPFNGSLMMLRAGSCVHVWDSFTPARAAKVPYFAFPDDQSWLWHTLPTAAGWRAGHFHGVYGFQKKGWPVGNDELPHGARYVAFFGSRDPSQFTHLPWVQEHWVNVANKNQ